MNAKERIMRALRRQEPDRIPTFEWDIHPQVGRALTGSGDILDIVERLDLDGVAVRPDYARRTVSESVYVDEWGSRRQMTGEMIHVITENPIRALEDHRRYAFPDPRAPHRLRTLERAVERFADRRAVILNVRDVFSDIRDLVGYENALVALLTARDAFAGLLDRVIEYNRSLARVARERYGIAIIATTDDIADSRGLIFSPAVLREFLGPRFREVIRGFKELGYLCIKHCDGNIHGVLDYWIDAGIDCIDPVDPNAGMDLADLKKRFGERICLKGNINCEKSLVSGTEEEVRLEVKGCIEQAGRGGGYILSSSNTIHSGVKPENYRVMLESLRRYGRYPLGGGTP